MANIKQIRLSGVTYNIVDDSALHNLDNSVTSGGTNAVKGSGIYDAITASSAVVLETVSQAGYQTASDVQNAISGKVDTSAITSFFGAVEYDSQTKRINFYNESTSGEVLAYVDATDFIKDGMVDNVEIKDVTISGASVTCLVITFNTDAGKEEIDIPISDIFDASNYYTKAEVDAAISAATVTVDAELNSGSTNPVANSAITTTILNNEAVISAALNDLNSRKADVSAVTRDLATKQDVLSAGTGIVIENDVISCVATGEQSDWNETDTNSEAYIKNKPFGGTGGWVTVIYSNDSGRTVDISDGTPVDLGYTLSVGKQYQIRYDSEYHESPDYYSNLLIVATPQNNNTGAYTEYTYIMGYDPEDPEKAFAVSNDLQTWTFYNSMASGYGVYLCIYDFVNDPLVQLDSKYIKNDIARTSAVTSEISAAVSGKQDTLISGTNIKTINNESILGSGNIDIQGGGTVDQTIISGSTNAVAGGAVYTALEGKNPMATLDGETLVIS